jgi:hypothetical protein
MCNFEVFVVKYSNAAILYELNFRQKYVLSGILYGTISDK